MAWPTRSLVLYVGLPFLGACALALFFWQRKEEEEWREMIRGLNLVEREVRVPHSIVPLLIGRGGANLKEMQETTNTKIFFRDGENHLHYSTCRVTGKAENVYEAINSIMEVINSQADFKETEMFVPKAACGRIIGRCGDTIKSISEASTAKIRVSRDNPNSAGNSKTSITIRGTEDAIKKAIELIEEKVKEYEAEKAKPLGSNRRSARGLMSNHNETSVVPGKPSYEKLVATAGESMLKVYVSAVCTPSVFWVQVVSPWATNLDVLVEEMTEYYKDEENRVGLEFNEIHVGLIVACFMPIDSKWYRVKISKIPPTGEDMIDVFNVDYGDSDQVPLKDLCHLHDDFLSLRFQAVQVEMDGIAPKEGDDWSEAAIDNFMDLTHTGSWRALAAEVTGYKKRSPQCSRPNSPIPYVKLYDPDGPPGVDLGQLLIDRGIAKAIPPSDDVLPAENMNGHSADDDDDW
ncbi:Tudor domain [Nesidiocoris tenuis]|uniref:Tudor domain n=1 Tax=Nesidiocoris tenuis TaxID=355587 RepID=A0ABN7AIN5_9HEMI|nr:Tudor domain [Nesidiocoris tenuis]